MRASKNKNSAYSAFNDDPTRIFVVVLPYQLQALKLVVLLQHVHSEFSIQRIFELICVNGNSFDLSRLSCQPTQVAILSMDWPEYLFKKIGSNEHTTTYLIRINDSTLKYIYSWSNGYQILKSPNVMKSGARRGGQRGVESS